MTVDFQDITLSQNNGYKRQLYCQTIQDKIKI